MKNEVTIKDKDEFLRSCQIVIGGSILGYLLVKPITFDNVSEVTIDFIMKHVKEVLEQYTKK